MFKKIKRTLRSNAIFLTLPGILLVAGVAFYIRLTHESPTSPSVVQVTDDQLAEEELRLTNLPSKPAAGIDGMMVQIAAKYGNQPVNMVVAGTDSTSGGIDGWRTCAKLKSEDFGLPAGTIHLFRDQNMDPCENNPAGWVSAIAFAVPEGQDRSIRQPTYKNEVMVVTVISIMTIVAK